MGRIFSILVLLSIFYCGQANSADAKPVPITASSWLVADGEGNVIESVNADQQRSIASITKLMTAIVILDSRSDLNEKIKGYTDRKSTRLNSSHRL